ncbi:MAG: type II toxin-antitoxin system HipA family toxin [Lysobacteraceae bacterium]|nr:type II toxin-antitoxin system HipA family toxin [Xanthomonadales bacterium]MCP5477251.1 type II toxin-antitoxin system HipA family toxin [Rhodanobacteraceae bacterium]HPF73989.1 type II toxin-antitoxin system HipA family toxin [Xanthomonadaceae bacterium]HRY00365.1 type II toxin-antitoxin system HipA family toxin [Xanthomonadaceae bacterium]
MATPTSTLAVWINGDLVGLWEQRRSGVQTFTYTTDWVNSPHARPLSLSLPLLPAGGIHSGASVENYFENLLPDSGDIRRRLRQRTGARSTAAFDLLAEIGRDCVGAVQLLPIGVQPEGLQQIDAELLTDAGVAQILRNVPVARAFGVGVPDDFRISIAGAQEKTALLWHENHWCVPRNSTPTTHIFKLPLGKVGNMQADFSTSVENEWLCSRIVEAFGIPIARTEIATFEDQKALIVERFDRRRSRRGDWWLRLPQEDMCQALGVHPDRKYEAEGGPGVLDIMELLRRSESADVDRHNFFKAQIVFWLLAATDGHAKNFSIFLDAGGSYRMTPLYDVLSAYPIMGKGPNLLDPYDAKLAMAVVSKNRHYQIRSIVPRQWVAMAKRCGVDGEQLLIEVAAQAGHVVEAVYKELSSGFPVAVVEPVFEGLTNAATRLA